MQVHVSIHDVSPIWAAEIELALRLAHEAGARPALLVVPNFHGKAPLWSAPAFCERLRQLQAAGHEIYLHGFFHDAEPRQDIDPSRASHRDRAGLRQRWYQGVVSNGEAEFRAISEPEASRRLSQGEEELHAAGLAIDGFVAPAWTMPRWLSPMLGARGYRFTEDHLRVYDPSRGVSRGSLVLNYASRTPARVLSTVAYCRIARPLGRLLPTRIAIHPADMHLPLLRHETASLLAWGRAGGWAERGRDLLG